MPTGGPAVPRRGLRALVAALPILLATPALGADDTTTLTGTYELLAVDHETGDGGLDHHYREVLRIPGKAAVPLSLAAGHGLRAGTRITVSAQPTSTGTYDVRTVRRLAPASSLGSPGVASVLVILAYWTAPDSVTPARAKAQFFTDDDAWFREVSYGKAGLAGVVTPWLKIPKPAGGQCLAGAETMMAYAQDKARSLGYDWTVFHRTVLYFPRCTGSDTQGVAGWAYEPGSNSWLNGAMDRRTTVHEQGHNYGMGHARAYSCTSASGARVTFSKSCVGSEYGDPYDAMGRTSYVAHFTGYRKNQAGWLGTTRRRILNSSSPTTFTLPPLERAATLPNVVVANSPTTAGRSYWLEYRRPIGMDARLPSGATGGVMIHLRDGTRFGLLDPTPRDASMTTAVLKPGTSWLSPDYVRFTVGTVSSTGARVTVTGAKPGPKPPSAPRDLHLEPRDSAVAASWSPPSSTGGASITGYRLVATAAGQTTVTRDVPATPTNAAVTGLRNGVTYTVSVSAKNSAGYGTKASGTAAPRSEAPSVRFLSPAPGTIVAGVVEFVVEAVPNALTKNQIQRVQLTAGASTWEQWWHTTPRFPVDTRTVPNGPLTVSVVAFDSVGRSARATLVVDVRNVAPRVAITSPADGASFHDVESIPVTATASVPDDPTATIAYVDFRDASGSFIGRDTTAPYALTWNVSLVSGTRDVSVSAFSSRGVAAGSRVTVHIAHPKPVITLTSPVPGSTVTGATIPLRADVSLTSATSAVSSVAFYVEGSWVGSDTTAPYEVLYSPGSGTGQRTIAIAVTETTGRMTWRSPAAFTVANAAPTVRVTEPTGVLAFDSPVTYRGVALPGAEGAEKPDRVVVSIEGVGLIGTAPVAADGTWSIDSHTGHRVGYEALYPRAYTPSGFASQATAYTFRVAGPPVTAAFVSPAEDAVVVRGTEADARVSVTLDERDPRSVDRVCFAVDTLTIGCQYHYADGTYSVPWPVSQPAGTANLTATVHMSEDAGTQTSRTVTIAEPPPPPPNLARLVL